MFYLCPHLLINSFLVLSFLLLFRMRYFYILYIIYGWLVVFSEVIQRRHPHLLSLAKDVKLGFYTVHTGNRTLGCCVAVHYTTAAPRQFVCLCFTSHRQRGHLETAPRFTVPCEGRGAR